MKLSILIPFIPSRFECFKKIYTKLEHQAQGRDVEILGIIDNKKRSIGLKREALVQTALGDYVAFCDDDDNVSDDYIVQLLLGISYKPDVVTFLQKCTTDKLECTVDFDLNHTENEPFEPNKVIKRRPFHVCAFKRSIAIRHHFPDSNWGEDWEWCKKVLKDVHTQAKMPNIIHSYIHDSEKSEARL